MAFEFGVATTVGMGDEEEVEPSFGVGGLERLATSGHKSRVGNQPGCIDEYRSTTAANVLVVVGRASSP